MMVSMDPAPAGSPHRASRRLSLTNVPPHIEPKLNEGEYMKPAVFGGLDGYVVVVRINMLTRPSGTRGQVGMSLLVWGVDHVWKELWCYSRREDQVVWDGREGGAVMKGGRNP